VGAEELIALLRSYNLAGNCVCGDRTFDSMADAARSRLNSYGQQKFALRSLGWASRPCLVADRCSELYITRIEAHHLPGGVSSNRAPNYIGQEVGRCPGNCKTASVSKMPILHLFPIIVPTLRLQSLNITVCRRW